MSYTEAMSRPDMNSAQLMEDRRKEATYLKSSLYPNYTRMLNKSAKRSVKELEFTVFTRPVPITGGMLWGASGTSKAAITDDTESFYFANAIVHLSVNDMIYVDGYQSTNSGTKTQQGETLRVASITSTNVFTATRNIASGTKVNCTGTGAANGLNFVLQSSSEVLGADTRTAKGLGKGDRKNYVSSLTEPFAMVAQLKDNFDMFPKGGEAELMDQRDDAFFRISQAINNRIYYGPKLKETTSAGTRYTSGGALYWLDQTDTEEGIAAWSADTDPISGDGSSRIWLAEANWNKPNVDKLILPWIFKEGGKTKMVYHGNGVMRNFRALFEDKLRYSVDTTDYGVNITSYTLDGCTLRFVYDPTLDRADSLGMFIFDEDYKGLAVKEDVHLRKPAYDPQTEVGPRVYKYDYVADIGNDLTYLAAHCIIRKITDLAVAA